MKRYKRWLVPVFVFVVVLLVFSLIALFRYEGLNKKSGLDIPPDCFLYLGKGGDYLVQRVVRDTVTFYDIHVRSPDGRNIIYPMRNSPVAVEDLGFHLPEKLSQYVVKEIVFVTQHPSLIEESKSYSLIAGLEFSRILGTGDTGVYQLNVEHTFTEMIPSVENSGISVRTCEDVSSQEAVVLLRKGSSTSLSVEGGCVIVQGKNDQ